MRPLGAAIGLALLLLAQIALARGDTLRVASFNVDLDRDGPGLLLRDLTRDKSAQIDAVVQVIALVSPDILAIQGIDWDHDGAALVVFVERLASGGVSYSHSYSARPNTGAATDLDLDGDGRLGGPGDAQGFGAFSGQGGMALLSRLPIRTDEVTDLGSLLWADLPGALLPTYPDGRAFPSEEARAVQRLSTTGHWIVPIELPDGETLSLMTFYATPPVFDGEEDRNGRRNHDEILIWRAVLDGVFGTPPDRFVIAGGANLDPQDSDGRTEAIRTLLSDRRLQDPEPASRGAAEMPDQGHRGANAIDTVDWKGIGRFRVDYVLPSANLTVADAGVFWPASDEAGHDAALAASRHRLVWVDLLLD